jgi:glycine betaine catabolism A
MSSETEDVAKTLPARYYTDPAVFSDELERFYSQMWVCVGRSNQVPAPGDYFLREIAGESLIVVRETKDTIRTFFNVCRHRGTRICPVAEGHFAGHIQCGYHGWKYALDGRLLGAPHMHEGFRREEYPLQDVDTDVWDGHIFVNMTKTSQSLKTQLSDLPQKFSHWRMEQLAIYRRITYDVKANWKLIMLNYNECLHCPVLHPALNAISDYRSGNNDEPNHSYIGGSMEFRDGAKTMSTDGKLRRAYLPGLTAEECTKVYYYAVFPNLLLSLHPDYMMTHLLFPRAVDRTEVVCEWHFEPAEMSKPDFAGDDAVRFWDETNQQDWSISELSQAGIRSKAYTQGPYSKSEKLLRAFDQMILEREKLAR